MRDYYDDPTLVDSRAGRSRRRGFLGGWLSRIVPGAWGSLAALAVLCLFVLLAPGEAATEQASILAPVLAPLVLLTVAAALGAAASLSGIRHLWTGDAPVRGVLGVAMGACPAWIAAAFLLLRVLGTSP